MEGQILGGRYHIISQLGRGGYGITLLAEDRQLPGNPRCIVKQFQPEQTDPKNLQVASQLFNAEAQVLCRLGNHPQIPQLLAHFEENQEFYLVQEFIEGHNLSQELTPGKPLSESYVIALLRDILEVLAFVHQQNVIHRDLKPENIRRRQDGKIVLIDFGLVKQLNKQLTDSQEIVTLTVNMGTRGYMPSEQALGKSKFSSDIYAVGMIAIQALTGLHPLKLPEDANDEIVWRDRVQVSSALADVLDKMVRYDFRQRYPSATEALQALKETGLIASLQAPPPPPDNPQTLLDKAHILCELKRYEDAIACYEEAILIQLDFHQAWHGRGKALYQLQRYEEAIASYDKVIQFQPDYAEAWFQRSEALYKLQLYKDAIASLDKALKIRPDYAEAWVMRGVILRNLQQDEEAIACYDKAIEFKPDYAVAWYNRGLVLGSLQRYEEAFACFDKVIQLQPNYGEAWYNRGAALGNLQRYEEAIASFNKAIEFKPDYAEAYCERGLALCELQRYEEAFACFDKVIQLQPNYGEAWFQRGFALYNLQRYEEAIASFDKAIEFNSLDAEAWGNRGGALYMLQRYEDAIASFDKAIQIKPDFDVAIENRKQALSQLKQ
jgi:tetratricopeptide (TPR) repeat protein